MNSIKIFHNPKCSKSRQTLELLKLQGVEPVVIEYLKKPLSKAELLQVLDIFEGDPMELVRTKEDLFVELNSKIETKEQIANILADYPQLMERPLVIKNKKAVLGRPPEKILSLFN
ncbi:MAG: arsenate reductase (glutaredoxin) [Bdellovibrionales bacterium]|nr:arsenate reductase (glutaredoxin) [Bdellovibrionales bacterium]